MKRYSSRKTSTYDSYSTSTSVRTSTRTASAMPATLRTLKEKSRHRLLDEKEEVDRKRNLLILIIKYLVDTGFADASTVLQREAGLSVSKFNVADNIDIEFIVQVCERCPHPPKQNETCTQPLCVCGAPLQEFENFYALQHNKKPVLLRKVVQAQRGLRHQRKRVNLRKARLEASQQRTGGKPCTRLPRGARQLA